VANGNGSTARGKAAPEGGTVIRPSMIVAVRELLVLEVGVKIRLSL
jgi:hypothetical protein